MMSIIKKKKQDMHHDGNGDNIKESAKISPIIGHERGRPEAACSVPMPSIDDVDNSSGTLVSVLLRLEEL